MYLLKLAMRPWRRAPLSQVFSSLAVGLLLALIAFMGWFQEGLAPLVERLKQEQVVTAYIDSKRDPANDGQIADEIRTRLSAAQVSAEVEVVGVSSFLKKLQASYPDLARELEGLGAEISAIVPRYVSVAGVLTDSGVSQIRSVPGVESAESSKDRYRHIVGAFSAVRWIARALALGLALALITGLVHLAKMNSYLHRDALLVLRQWGASRMTTRIFGLPLRSGSGTFGRLRGRLVLVGRARSCGFGHPWAFALSQTACSISVEQTLVLVAAGALVGALAGWAGQWAGDEK